MAEPDDEMEEHRYSHLMNATQQREFRETFVLFDYDGGGDVDLRELGMMLRKLGQAPSDAELAQMINDFDYDKSGTIDIEEFCGMMLASVRAAAVPKWLVARCDPPEGEDQLELRYEASESGSLRRPLSLDQQLFVIDMQRRNTHLTALSLHGNGLGSFAASELAHVLTHVNLTLRHLDLSRNLLADAGAAHVATMLRSNDQLTALDLSFNAIGAEGGNALLLALEAGRHGLVACDLRGNQLPEALLRKAAACCLTVALPAVLREATAPDGAISLAKLPLGASHAAQLHRHLCAALLPAPRLELRGAAALGGAGTRALFWAEAGAGTAAAAAVDTHLLATLARVPTSAPMRAPRLRCLTLVECGLDAHAAALLAAALCAGAMPKLRALYLSGNHLARGALAATDAPAAPAAPAELVAPVTPVARAASATLRSKKQLTLRSTTPPPPLLPQPPPLPPPSGLELLGEAIGKRPMLRRLDLSCDLTLDDAALAPCLRGIFHLGSAAERTSSAGAAPGKAPTCTALEAAAVPPAAAPSARPNTSGAAPAAAAVPHSTMHAPGDMRGVEQLDLTRTAASDGAAAVCAEAIRLGWRLKQLELGGCPVGDEGGQAIGLALRDAAASAWLRSLSLGGGVGDRTAAALALALAKGRSLTVLTLLSSEMSTRSAAALAQALRAGCSLTRLCLSGCPIDDDGCAHLCAALENNAKLRVLQLAGCGAGPAAVASLRKSLARNYTLIEAQLRQPGGVTPTGEGGEGGSGGGDSGGSGGGGGGAAGKLQAREPPLPMMARLELAALLESNRTRGKERIEEAGRQRQQERCAAQLKTLHPVYRELATRCTPGVEPAEWSAQDCGQFVANLGLPQFTATFAANLRGGTLLGLSTAQLQQLGVREAVQQGEVLAAIRRLLEAEGKRQGILRAFAWVLVVEGVDIAALQRRTCGADAHEDENSGHVVAHTQSTAAPITAALATAKSMDVLTASDSDSDSPPATPRPRGSSRRRNCAGANASAASSAAGALGAVAAVAVFATRARRASCAATPSRESCAAPAVAAQEQEDALSKVSRRRSSLEWAAAAATTVVAAETGTTAQEAAPAIRIRRRSTVGAQPAAAAAAMETIVQGAAPAIRIRRRSSCAGTQPAAVAAEVAAATAIAAATAVAAVAAAEAAAAEAAAAEAAAAEAAEAAAAAEAVAAAVPRTVSFKPHRPTAEIFLAAMVGTPSAPPPMLRSSWVAPVDDGALEQGELESGEAEAAASGTGGAAAPRGRRRSTSPTAGTLATHGPAEVKQGSHSAMLLRRNGHEEEAAPVAFKRFDTDGDGTISKAEFSALLTCPSASRPPLTPDEVERLFAKLDLDGNGSIDLREFGQAWTESSGDLAALVPMTAEMQAAQTAAADAAAAEEAASEQAAAEQAAAQEAATQETRRRNAKTSRYLRRSTTVAVFPSTVAQDAVAQDAVAAAAAAGAAIADAAAADAAAKRSADFAAAKPARRRAKSSAIVRPSPLLLGDDEGSDDTEEGTSPQQIDLTALTETNETGASETATSGAAFGAAADGACPPRGANLSSRLLSLRTSASERAPSVSGGGYVASSARSLASKAKAYQVATTVEEMLAVQTLGSPRQGTSGRDSTPTSPASAASNPPKWRRCSGSSGPRPGSSGSCRPGTPTSPLSSPPKWQRPPGPPGSCRPGQQSPSSPQQNPSPPIRQDRSGSVTPLLTKSYHVQPRYHGPPQPRSTSPLMSRHEKSYPRSASVQDMGRHRLRYQPKDVAWERMTRTNGATPTARLLPQVEVRPAFAALDHQENGEPPPPLLAQLLQQVDSHVDGSYEHWFLPRKYTTTPAALISWRDGR